MPVVPCQDLEHRFSLLWAEMSDNVHVVIPKDLRSGPDLFQCYCGYFSFDQQVLQTHLDNHPYDANMICGYITRLDRVGVHETCKQKVIDAQRGGHITLDKPTKSHI
jgi:hypothetical protein